MPAKNGDPVKSVTGPATALVTVTPNPPTVAVVVFHATSEVPAVKDPPPLIAAKPAKPVLAGIPAPLLEKAIRFQKDRFYVKGMLLKKESLHWDVI